MQRAMLDFPKLLRTNGFRATRGRVALLEALFLAHKPLSIPEIVRSKNHDLDQVTVYRAIHELVRAGMIRRIDVGHAHADYELVVGKDHHHHMVCIECNTVKDISSCGLEVGDLHHTKKKAGFVSVTDHSFELFGVCARCAAV